MNHRQRVESVGMVSKPGRVGGPGRVHEKPVVCVGGIRHRGGMTLDQALVWNVKTCRLDAKGEIQGDDPQG